MRLQAIYNIASICYESGIRDVIICPGSRCAPLTLAFTRFGKFNVRVFSDERSAAFIGLGIAQATNNPVVLICTSGSAVYNFAPAVAEAFFSGIPLLVLSADRPSEWINQYDGQTIFQHEIFGKHVKQSHKLPQEYEHQDNIWNIYKTVAEAIQTSLLPKKGPVHINVPLREPLYPTVNEIITFETPVQKNEVTHFQSALSIQTKNIVAAKIKSAKRILIVAGQGFPKGELKKLLASFATQLNAPILADVISNFHGIENGIHHADTFLGNLTDEQKEKLQPDLLLSFGMSVISKQIKLFLRQKNFTHFHIGEEWPVADPFQSQPQAILTNAENFLHSFQDVQPSNPDTVYLEHWNLFDRKAKEKTNLFFKNSEKGEFKIVSDCLRHLPENCNLHVANSMSVRYANYCGIHKNNVTIYANRGTSGIDGCTSTVVGHCLAHPEKLNIFITGDIAFFYDRNAFWHRYDLPNLRIILLNNRGGVIFKLIDGPADLPEANDYFVTKQKYAAKYTCEENNIEYHVFDNNIASENFWTSFFEKKNTPALVEFNSDVETNRIIFEQFKKQVIYSIN
ncbi:MAG: 2-succinyl-5-enolpyruvyl-6-hydroxy-3-cyclohexene-1-carboxylic-acid synthase [Cyclobacteriaceae bacterium]|nr:2-succinyl-5-enolpyruvyl-6-hydroxy-3-cyclohexene-1-carboxylic-acid synthase [Cyclobacteriaceae bacterium]